VRDRVCEGFTRPGPDSCSCTWDRTSGGRRITTVFHIQLQPPLGPMCEFGDTHLGELSTGTGEDQTVSSLRPQPCLPQRIQPCVRRELWASSAWEGDLTYRLNYNLHVKSSFYTSGGTEVRRSCTSVPCEVSMLQNSTGVYICYKR
jgi:hypothetical protein